MTRRALAERFYNKVEQPPYGSACWLWIAARDERGYGHIALNHVNSKAYRVSWEIHRGAIPAGLHVLHRCDNPPCVNPDHLFLGTNRDNTRDRDQKRRHRCHSQTHCKRGHEFTPDNTIRVGDSLSHRACRNCAVAKTRRWRAVQKEKSN